MIRIVIMGGSGVGKTSILNFLKQDSRFKGLKIADIDEFLPFEKMKKDTLETQPLHWDGYELEAAQKAVSVNFNIIFGVMTNNKIQKYLQDNGYTLYALVVSEDVQRKRIARREIEAGKKVNIEASLHGNKILSCSIYPKIDGDKELKEIANDIFSIIQG